MGRGQVKSPLFVSEMSLTGNSFRLTASQYSRIHLACHTLNSENLQPKASGCLCS